MKIACLVLAGLSALAFVMAVIPKKNGAKRNVVFLILCGILAVALGAATIIVT